MNANSYQVGGTHYQSVYQHWDLAADLDMGWVEYQVTKYVTRNRSKNGKVDAEKALHFLQKGLELARFNGRLHAGRWPTSEQLLRYGDANKLNPRERQIIFRMLTWSTADVLSVVESLLRMLIDECYPPKQAARVPAPHSDQSTTDADPGPGYVNQDPEHHRV